MSEPKETDNLFTSHPHSLGETYGQHFRYAMLTGLKITFAGLACIIHSIFPFMFITTASDSLKEIHQNIADRKTPPMPPKE